MTLEEGVVVKLQQLPENDRRKLLILIDAWIEQHRLTDTRDVQASDAASFVTGHILTVDGGHSVDGTVRWS